MAHLTEEKYLNAQNMLVYLNAFALEMRKRYGNIQFDMLIVGGSAIALKGGYRNSTVDIDSYIRFSNDTKGAIQEVAKQYNIYADWLNQDFMYSGSFSFRLVDHAIYYTTIQNTIHVYVVDDLDQLCMKATAYRKKDMMDIRYLVNLLKSKGITFDDFLLRFEYLYQDKQTLSYNAKSGIKRLFR